MLEPPKALKLAHQHTEDFEVPRLETASRAQQHKDQWGSSATESDGGGSFKAQPIPDYAELGRIVSQLCDHVF